MYTQCPQCLTIYEIDEDALQASLGIVRCGHCSERFDALRTLSDSLPASPGAVLPEHASEAVTPTLTEAIAADVIEAAGRRQRRRSDPVAPSEPDTPPVEDAPLTPTEDTWFAPLAGERARALIADAAGIPQDAIAGDPAWQAIDLPLQTHFAELATTPVTPREAAPEDTGWDASAGLEGVIGVAESEPFTEPWSVDIPDAGVSEPETSLERSRRDIVQHPAAADALTDGTDTHLEPHAATPFSDADTEINLPDGGTIEDTPPFANGLSWETGVIDEAIEPAKPLDESSIADADPASTESESGAGTATEPVYVPPRRRRIRRGDWLLASGCLILVLALAAQITWAQRVSLVRDPATQAWTLRACATFTCRLPPIRDVAKLELLSRDIRPDPDAAGALMITATVRNDAAFRQPWPVVVVELTDLDNDVVAMRRFRPAEYMPDPARRAAGLAPGTTTAVAFEVVDPGKRAVSFHFSFE